MPPTRLVVLTILLFASPAAAQSPLHERIDRLIMAGHADYAKVAAPRCDDAEFLRRVSLDVAGVIPSAAEVRAFLADRNPDRRVKLIDRLLASEKHAYHLADVFDVLLMDRRANKHVKRAEWLGFLRESFKANKPYDQLVREILSADGSDPQTRAAARFFLDRDGEPHVLTRDIGRLFLGMNLKCAQCHDHPLVNGYKQDYYYGIFAFLNRSYLYTDKAKKLTVFAEKADGDVSFSSVFMAKVTKKTGPRLPDGPEVAEPKLAKGHEYVAAVKPGQRGIPKFSRRAQLAAKLTGAANRRFARSAVNRIWSMYLGRGLVHPIDFDHEGNPPSHPELLTVLTDEFVAHEYDLRWLTREISLERNVSAFECRAGRYGAGRDVVRGGRGSAARAGAVSMEPAAGDREAGRRAPGAG